MHYCGTRNLIVIECMYLCLKLNSLLLNTNNTFHAT